MLKISKLADYAIVIMTEMAHDKMPMNATLLHERTGIGLPTIRKLLQKLVKNGLLQSTRGVLGGYTLKMQNGTISFLHVIEAIDGPLLMTDCAEHKDKCKLAGHCKSREHWQSINHIVKNVLAEKRL